MNNILSLGLILTVAAFIGCASHDTSRSDRAKSNQIVGITFDIDSDSLILNIQANQLLNYTEDRIANPNGIVFSFPTTKIDGLKRLYTPPENEVVRYCRADAYAVNMSPIATIYISLKTDTPYLVTRENDSLQVTFHRQSALSNTIAPQEKPAR